MDQTELNQLLHQTFNSRFCSPWFTMKISWKLLHIQLITFCKNIYQGLRHSVLQYEIVCKYTHDTSIYHLLHVTDSWEKKLISNQLENVIMFIKKMNDFGFVSFHVI